MAVFRGGMLLRRLVLPSPALLSSRNLLPTCSPLSATFPLPCRTICSGRVLCMASDSGDGGKKVSARLSQMQQILQEAEERAGSAGNEPTPKITLDHVSVSFARSGGPGGQNVNKVNTKVDMRFNVKNAYWLSDRVQERIMQMEKNRINKDGEIVISSTKTRTQKGNIEDALGKLQVKDSMQLLMLLHMSHHLLQKSKRKRLPSWLLLVNRSVCRTRRLSHKKRPLGEAEIVGTDHKVRKMLRFVKDLERFS